jgi:hypothetical protein
MAKVKQGKKVKGKWIEEEVDDPTALSRDDVIKVIGIDNIKVFDKWMRGQGCPILSNGSIGYFKWDVEKFKRHHIDGIPYLSRDDIDKIFKDMDKKKRSGNNE